MGGKVDHACIFKSLLDGLHLKYQPTTFASVVGAYCSDERTS